MIFLRCAIALSTQANPTPLLVLTRSRHAHFLPRLNARGKIGLPTYLLPGRAPPGFADPRLAADVDAFEDGWPFTGIQYASATSLAAISPSVCSGSSTYGKI